VTGQLQNGNILRDRGSGIKQMTTAFLVLLGCTHSSIPKCYQCILKNVASTINGIVEDVFYYILTSWILVMPTV
jgi:hypothetical protein